MDDHALLIKPRTPHRSDPRANPLTYYERYVMVREVLDEAGVGYGGFSIVPFPVNLPRLYRCYVPLDATCYLTIYDDWGRRKLEQFESMGLRTQVPWMRSLDEEGLRDGEIPRSMVTGDPWEHLVPPSDRATHEAPGCAGSPWEPSHSTSSPMGLVQFCRFHHGCEAGRGEAERGVPDARALVPKQPLQVDRGMGRRSSTAKNRFHGMKTGEKGKRSTVNRVSTMIGEFQGPPSSDSRKPMSFRS